MQLEKPKMKKEIKEELNQEEEEEEIFLDIDEDRIIHRKLEGGKKTNGKNLS
ncbi:hypothetical protein ES703_31407 [subsurface metagenome]